MMVVTLATSPEAFLTSKITASHSAIPRGCRTIFCVGTGVEYKRQRQKKAEHPKSLFHFLSFPFPAPSLRIFRRGRTNFLLVRTNRVFGPYEPKKAARPKTEPLSSTTLPRPLPHTKIGKVKVNKVRCENRESRLGRKSQLRIAHQIPIVHRLLHFAPSPFVFLTTAENGRKCKAFSRIFFRFLLAV